MSSQELLALALALALVAVHLIGGSLRFLDRVPRSRLLSAFGGVSVAYVVVHLLPDVAEAQETLDDVAADLLSSIERHAYVLVLVGLVGYYSLEQVARRSTTRRATGAAPGSSARVFWLSMLSFGAYNLLVGYLLVERAEHEGTANLLLFGVALALHFVVNDFGLRAHHERRYDAVGRWILAGAVVAGWAGASAFTVSAAALAAVEAFLAGGIIVNVLKEELPEDRQSRVGAFVGGSAAYAALLLASG